MLRLLTLGLLFGLFLPHATAQKPSHAPLETRLQAEPGIVHGSDGHSYLALELHLTNVDSQRSPITLERLRILDADTNGEIANLTGNATWKSMRVVSPLASPDADPSIVGPSEHVLLYLFLPLPASTPAPKHVEENLTIRVAGMDHSLDFICCKAAVREPTVVAAPLKGAGWAAINGPSNQSIHRRALVTVDGRLLLGQRFAIDWMQTDSSGKFSRGKGDKNEDFFCFGHPLLAVADGTVEATHDGIPENPPGGRAVEIDYNTLAGNFVVLKIGDGIYAGYAHLQPGSLRVKVGDHVKRGDVLGLLGNTGNSDAPHLHFQLMDAPSIAISDGLPYAFTTFDTTGTVTVGNTLADFHVVSTPAADHKAQIPLEDVVVKFPE